MFEQYTVPHCSHYVERGGESRREAWREQQRKTVVGAQFGHTRAHPLESNRCCLRFLLISNHQSTMRHVTTIRRTALLGTFSLQRPASSRTRHKSAAYLPHSPLPSSPPPLPRRGALPPFSSGPQPPRPLRCRGRLPQGRGSGQEPADFWDPLGPVVFTEEMRFNRWSCMPCRSRSAKYTPRLLVNETRD